MRRPAKKPPQWGRRITIAGSLLFALWPASPLGPATVKLDPLPERVAPAAAQQDIVPEAVWLVSRGSEADLYSNGLRVENRYRVSNVGRPLDGRPAGIVFHTTESHQAPFAEERSRELTRIGANLIAYIRRHKSYHFVIDRFGRVNRVVEEADAANHAGWSIWADARREYVGLNQIFLGVALEAETAAQGITPAQLQAGKTLIAMLRSKYEIAAANCVTHGQVSVNPHNFRVGHHTDWGGSFPFTDLGLPDNYSLPLPAIAHFGFRSDGAFAQAAGPRLLKSVELAERQLAGNAAARGVMVEAYRAELRKQFQGFKEQIP